MFAPKIFFFGTLPTLLKMKIRTKEPPRLDTYSDTVIIKICVYTQVWKNFFNWPDAIEDANQIPNTYSKGLPLFQSWKKNIQFFRTRDLWPFARPSQLEAGLKLDHFQGWLCSLGCPRIGSRLFCLNLALSALQLACMSVPWPSVPLNNPVPRRHLVVCPLKWNRSGVPAMGMFQSIVLHSSKVKFFSQSIFQ